MKRKLKPIESRILTVLIKKGEWMTTAEVAKEAHVSWNTALLYLKRFESDGWIDKQGEYNGGTIYWYGE